MPSNLEKESWTIDQLSKSEFFHEKLHEWGLIEITYELDEIKGDEFNWDRNKLNISEKAWNKVIHEGIKPIKIFCHPEVLVKNPKIVGYYRMLAMVSQKSMGRVGLNINSFETGENKLSSDLASQISRHLNKIISILIEQDKKIDPREFDIWRGMAAGSQAQGSWQNLKGDKAEIVIKDLLERISKEKSLIIKEVTHGKGEEFHLKDGRVVILGSEPDIGVYYKNIIQYAVEIKGGIDTAGVLERFGAALKSLRRAKQENPKSITILIMQGVSLTSKAKDEIERSRAIIDHFFTIEEVINEDESRKKLFKILNI